MQRIRVSTMAIYDVLYLSSGLSITNTLIASFKWKFQQQTEERNNCIHSLIVFPQVNNNTARVKSILHYEFSAPQKSPHCLLYVVVDLDCVWKCILPYYCNGIQQRCCREKDRGIQTTVVWQNEVNYSTVTIFFSTAVINSGAISSTSSTLVINTMKPI